MDMGNGLNAGLGKTGGWIPAFGHEVDTPESDAVEALYLI